MSVDKTVILFDGVCNFCNRWVNFLIARDRDDRFRFAAQQSEAGQAVLKQHGLDSSPGSVVVTDGGKVYQQSAATVRIFWRMGWPWKLGSTIWLVPRPIRDWAYRLLAKNRYRWFGRHDACRLPTPAERGKFL